jgi:hypothetical protein
MRIPNPPGYQWTGFWWSMPFISLALCAVMYKEKLWSDPWIWVTAYPLIYFIGYFSFRAHYVYDYFLIRKYPSLKDTRKRVLYKIPINLFVMTPSLLVILATFDALDIRGYAMTWEDVELGYLVGLGVNIIFESLWEVIYIIDKYKEAAADQQMIEQLQLRQEFDNLKQKVNPHFLFNSFNTLSSLISEDPVQAEKFLDELSKVYRYLLRSNESGISTVAQETDFIRSYAGLLSTRFGEGFRLELDLTPADRERYLPALCLQLLVENAVKHNVISRTRPVMVRIFSGPPGFLTIENNLHPKTRLIAESTGIGLANIREKYRLLKRGDVRIEETADTFRVVLPLLATPTEHFIPEPGG